MIYKTKCPIQGKIAILRLFSCGFRKVIANTFQVSIYTKIYTFQIKLNV